MSSRYQGGFLKRKVQNFFSFLRKMKPLLCVFRSKGNGVERYPSHSDYYCFKDVGLDLRRLLAHLLVWWVVWIVLICLGYCYTCIYFTCKQKCKDGNKYVAFMNDLKVTNSIFSADPHFWNSWGRRSRLGVGEMKRHILLLQKRVVGLVDKISS